MRQRTAGGCIRGGMGCVAKTVYTTRFFLEYIMGQLQKKKKTKAFFIICEVPMNCFHHKPHENEHPMKISWQFSCENCSFSYHYHGHSYTPAMG